jgi:hypothetical protein
MCSVNVKIVLKGKDFEALIFAALFIIFNVASLQFPFVDLPLSVFRHYFAQLQSSLQLYFDITTVKAGTKKIYDNKANKKYITLQQ